MVPFQHCLVRAILYGKKNVGRGNLSTCSQILVNLKRRVGNQLFNTYLPTGCIIVIIYFTHYFKIEHYDTRIMVALTGT